MMAEEVANPIVRTRRTKFSLFRKEWQQQRILIVWSVALMIALFVGDVALSGLESTTGRHFLLDDNAMELLVIVTCYLSAAICGSAIVAPEVGAGTVQFLSSLPIRRNAVWWVKTAVTAAIYAVTVFSVFACTCLLIGVAHEFGIAESASSFFTHVIRPDWPTFLPAVSVLVAGALVTMLLDRTISAVMVTALFSIGAGTVIATVADRLNIWTPDFSSTFWICCITPLATISGLYVSHQLFVKGETLRTAKRLKILTVACLCDLGIVAAALFAAYWLIFNC
jgi:ABC-type transport system involved in multi-copper enzyme maturation permease subunit